MRRVLLDQGLSPLAARLLRANNWDAVHVLEVDLDEAEDTDILAFARSQDRVCVTLDHDFHTHLALAQADGPSVILLRIEGLRAADQVQLIQKVWAQCEHRIEEGAAISVDSKSIRIRKLPLR